MLTVTTPATNAALITLAAVKLEINLTTTTDDDYLNSKIPEVIDEIYDYMKVKRAADGTRTIAQETLLEIFRPERSGRFRSGLGPGLFEYGPLPSTNRRKDLVLARWPVTAIGSVIEGTTTLDPSQYEVTPAGVLSRLSNGYSIGWSHSVIQVAYTAGWIIASDNTNTLPGSLKAAAIDYVKELRLSRRRDSKTKSENVVGIVAREFWVGQVGDEGSMPPNVTSRLDRYRRVSLGAG
jgi:hypothetical protein